MQISKNKKKTIFSLALILVISLAIIPLSTDAHTPPWTIPTYAYIGVSPNPIGVGQTATIVFWLDKVPPTAAGLAGDVWRNIEIVVTKPDSTTDTLGPYSTDTVGGGYTTYTPDTTGEYTFEFIFPGQVAKREGPTGLLGTDSVYVNDTYLASNATTTITVQEQAVIPIGYPLPTEYWTRPIEGQNTGWYSIASNWLAQWPGGGMGIEGRVQPDGIAPNTAHIAWTKPFQSGGVVGGGTYLSEDGMTYYSGTEYEGKFRNGVIIMDGNLFYELPRSDDPTGGGYVCVDLLTGEQIWYKNISISFGQLYDYESMNQHGVIPSGYLWNTPGGTFVIGFGMGSGTWKAYDPESGELLFTLTDVPSGTIDYGPNGEILVFKLDSVNKWAACWNNTASPALTAAGVAGTTSSNYQWRPVGKTVNMSQSYSWNVTLPSSIPAGSAIRKVIAEDILVASTGTIGGVGAASQQGTVWAISLKPESRGTLLWSTNIPAPSGNRTLTFGTVDADARVFTMYEKETMQWWGYDLDTGAKLWGPTDSEGDWNYYSGPSGTIGVYGTGSYTAANGKLYSTGLAGKIYCYDETDGALLWNYTVPSTIDILYGDYPFLFGAIADDKIYTGCSIHSANAPHFKGLKVYCINATSGDEIWSIDGWAADGSMAVADDHIIYLNLYDQQIYCLGKGPTQTSVTASPKVTTEGSSVLIEGNILDISSGTSQNEQAARFPNGVPVVSDSSMSAWMEYVYMQKPKPTDTIGVTVELNVLDSNGNYRPIGTATTDASGFYSYQWTPDIAGKYTVIATFGGSEAYWPSNSETAFAVDEAAPTPTQQPVAAAPPTEMYFAISTAAIIIAIAIVGIFLGLMLKKRP
jgi:outer membrane protein assembly factor BamB